MGYDARGSVRALLGVEPTSILRAIVSDLSKWTLSVRLGGNLAGRKPSGVLAGRRDNGSLAKEIVKQSQRNPSQVSSGSVRLAAE